MNSKTLSVGDYIDSKCTKCKRATNHIIVAMVEEKVARVECRTCSGEHNYRPPTAEKKPASTSPAKGRKPSAAKRKAAEAAEEVVKVREEVEKGERQSRTYNMEGSFSVDEAIAHPSFGIGVVKSLNKPNKMDVQFESGLKCLRCQL